MSANCVIFTYYTGEISKVSKNYNQLWRNFTQKCISLEICKNFTYKNSTTQYKKIFTVHQGLGFITLFIQYYSAICRPSDHTVGRPPGRDSSPGRVI